MKKRLCVVIAFGLMFGGGFIMGLLCHRNAWINVDSGEPYSLLVVLYYLFTILGAIGTLCAVLVALFKESILNFLHHPDLSFTLTDSDGFVEEIDSSQQNPQADKYNCVLKITNNGTIAASSCFVCIEDIGYADSKGRTLHKMKDYQNKMKLWWEDPYVEIPKGLSKEIRLFNIDAVSGVGTPVSNSACCHLELNGFKLKDNKSKKGYWEICYCIGYNNGEHKHFKLIVDWNGEWKTRKTEMKDVLHIKLEEK